MENGKSTVKDACLSSNRLEMRPVVLTDITDDYLRWMNDQQINQHMETRFRNQKMEDVQSYVQAMQANKNVLFLAMLLKENRQHIGNIKMEIAPFHSRGEISLWIGAKDQWGKGLATEAIRCLRDYGIDDLHLAKITAGCYSCNVGSAKAFLNAGFEQEAVLKEQYICDGRRVDRYCFSYLNPGKR